MERVETISWHSARWSGRRTPPAACTRPCEQKRTHTRESNGVAPVCVCDVCTTCVCLHRTSHDFALTQCQWQLPMERALFGSRSIEGVHPAYVVNTLTIPLDEAAQKASATAATASLAARFHQRERRPPTRQPDEESNVCLRHYDLRPRGQEASLLIALRSDRPLRSGRFAARSLHAFAPPTSENQQPPDQIFIALLLNIQHG